MSGKALFHLGSCLRASGVSWTVEDFSQTRHLKILLTRNHTQTTGSPEGQTPREKLNNGLLRSLHRRDRITQKSQHLRTRFSCLSVPVRQMSQGSSVHILVQRGMKQAIYVYLERPSKNRGGGFRNHLSTKYNTALRSHQCGLHQPKPHLSG